MLRFQRAIHTSRSVLQQASESAVKSSASLNEITSYLAYFKTQKDLRPLVYRKRNASQLLSRDLWDAEAKQRVVPLDPPHLPSKHALGNLFLSSESPEELYEVRELMVQLARKPKYTTSLHISSFLERSAELSKLSHAITYVYSQKHIKHVLDASVTNTILTYLYINPNKTVAGAISKADIAISKIGHSDSLTDLLKASIYHKHSTAIPQELREQITSAEAITSLPSLHTDKSIGSLARQLKDKRLAYIQLSPIAKELTEEPLVKDSANVVAIKQFVEDYKKIQSQLESEDAFAAFQARAVFGKPEPESQPELEAKEGEETQ